MTHAYWFKYIMIGDYSVGKSSILRRFIESNFKTSISPTTAPEFISQTMSINNIPIKVEVWDTSGSENYMSVTRNYYRNCAAAILVYDITRRESFQNILRWYQEAKNNSTHDNMVYLLIGNKTDLNSQ